MARDKTVRDLWADDLDCARSRLRRRGQRSSRTCAPIFSAAGAYRAPKCRRFRKASSSMIPDRSVFWRNMPCGSLTRIRPIELLVLGRSSGCCARRTLMSSQSFPAFPRFWPTSFCQLLSPARVRVTVIRDERVAEPFHLAQPARMRTWTALTRSVARVGQDRIRRRIFQLLS
jgi:hypothetical protein